MIIRRSVLVLTSLLAITSSVAQAEDPSTVGRQRDGRAYRIDQEGVRISDQLAEFEVENNELKRQIATLEDDLISAREKLRGGKATEPLAAMPQATKPSSQLVPIVSCPAPKACPSAPSCDAELVPVRQKLSTAESELSRQQNATIQCQGELAPLQGEVESLRLTQAKLPTAELVERLTTERTQLKTELAAKDRAIEEQRSELQQLNSAIALAKAAPPVEPAPRAVLATSPKLEEPQRDSQEELSVPELRRALQNKLGVIQTLIISRKTLKDRASSNSRGVSVRIQPLIAKNGASLDELRVLVSRLDQDGSGGADIQSGLSQIESILQQDIAVLSRLSKIR